MRLDDEFTIATTPERAFELLLDLRRVGPCVPGAEIGEPDDEGTYPGRVTVRIGPMKFVYAGRVSIKERDPVALSAVIAGEGKASGGADVARVETRMAVLPAGNGSRVTIATSLDIKGRAAQMGQGVIAEVGRKLVRDAVACIESRLADPAATAPAGPAAPVSGIGLMASVVGSKVGGTMRRLGNRERPEAGGDKEDDRAPR